MVDRSHTVLPHHLIPPAAIWEPNGELNCEAPVNFDSKTVAGSIFGSLIMVTATRNSFHAPMKTMIAVVKMPGPPAGG